MLNHQTVERLKELRLEGMAQAFLEQLNQAVSQELSFEERLGMLVDREIITRENRRLEKLLKSAKLRQSACVEDIDFGHPRGLEKAQTLSLGSCEWIKRGQNLHLTGLT